MPDSNMPEAKPPEEEPPISTPGELEALRAENKELQKKVEHLEQLLEEVLQSHLPEKTGRDRA